MRDAFRDLLARRRAELETKRDEHIALVGWDDRDDSLYEITVESVAELIDEKVVKDDSA